MIRNRYPLARRDALIDSATVHQRVCSILVLATLSGCQRRGGEADAGAGAQFVATTTPPAGPSPVEVPDASLDAADDAQSIRDAGFEAAWVCVPPHRGSYPECENINNQESRDCLREHPYKPNYVPRFRVAAGRWIDVSAKHWTCTPIPKTEKVRLTLDTAASWNVSVPSDCASGVIDMEGPNFYNAYWTTCSKRQRTDDVSVSE